jgi:hypothetical protein
MKTIVLFSDEIEKLVSKVFALQFVIMLLSALLLDGGTTAQINCVALAGFWCGAAFIVIRRRFSPTKFDLAYFQWGFLLLVLTLNPLVRLVWYLSGMA